ncbi:hypothetical protein EV122DRAFT_271148 [Schizophyllum commune]
MTVSQRKQAQIEEVQTVNEPGDQIHCDACGCDLTHSIRFKCAAPECQTEEGVDICPPCFCAGKEFAGHKRTHPYRVIEFSSNPIFTEDWGADEELLLLKGIASFGFGNWKRIAEHVGTRTKEEVEEHYHKVYIESKDWPLPQMDATFDIPPAEFQDRKRRRIAKMSATVPPPPPTAPISAPSVHDVHGFLPGRLEFDKEIEDQAEDLVKDLEFGVVLKYGGEDIPEDPNDVDVKARARWEEEKRKPPGPPVGVKGTKAPRGMPGKKAPVARGMGKDPNGHSRVKKEDEDEDDEEEGDDVTYPPPLETEDSLNLKLTMLEMYAQKVQKRMEAKAVMFDRGLMDYKKMQANDKKRQREERDILQRLRPFAKLQTAEDFEVFSADILYEALLRKRIQDLQNYRRLGLQTTADIERYDIDLAKRAASAKAATAHSYYARPRATPADSDNAAKRPGPLNLANSPALHLLTPAEQTLCSQLRILPRPYLVVKETLVREYARRGGKLRRREARDLVKIDVNKTSRVWDFLVQAGYLNITSDNLQGQKETGVNGSSSQPPGTGTTTPALGGQSGGNAPTPTPPKPPITVPPSSTPA